MKVIIPVAGTGTRLRPHTHTTPKVLIKVAGKAIIQYIIDELLERGIKDIILIVGYLGEQIEEFLKENYNANFNFVYQQERKGIAHAIRTTKDLIQREEEVFIILGDTIFDTDYEFLKSDTSMLGVHQVDNPQRFGIVMVQGDSIVDLVEKPEKSESNLAIVGLYYIKNWGELLDAIEQLFKDDITTKGEYQITDALNLMIKNGHKMGYFKIKGWYDCGKFDAVLETNRVLLEKKKGKFTSEEMKNHKLVELKNNLVIEPCHISAEVNIKGSIIGPFVSIGKDVNITHSIISNSIINDRTTLENVDLDNSIIGHDTVVRGRAKSLNIGDNSQTTL